MANRGFQYNMSINDNQSEKREPINLSEVKDSVAQSIANQPKKSKFSAFRQASMLDLCEDESNSNDNDLEIQMNEETGNTAGPFSVKDNKFESPDRQYHIDLDKHSDDDAYVNFND